MTFGCNEVVLFHVLLFMIFDSAPVFGLYKSSGFVQILLSCGGLLGVVF